MTVAAGAERPAPWPLTVATASIALAAVPVFLLGALAVFVRADLEFSEALLGLLASAYYASSTLMSIPGGRITERMGRMRGVATGATLTAAAMFGIAALAWSWAALLIFMIIAGAANGFALPASNLVLARDVPRNRQGAAFGLKQSSGPIATLVAGSAVPAIGLTVGWRWAFALIGALALPLMLTGLARRPAATAPSRPARSVATGALSVLAVGAACAVVGGSSIAAFYVESAVSAGLSPSAAGILLAAGSVVGIVGRILWGWIAGRRHTVHVSMLGWLMVIGAAGYFWLGNSMTVTTLALSTFVVFVSGWGWPGLFNFAVVVRSPSAPAAATGVVATGLYAGGIVGPFAFGLLVEIRGYLLAWSFVAVLAVVAAVMFVIGGRMLESRQGVSPAVEPIVEDGVGVNGRRVLS